MSAVTYSFQHFFLERIMTNALEDEEGSVSIGERTITNLCFVDDIDAPAEKEEELFKFFNQLDKASTTCDIEISAEKTKRMTDNRPDISFGGQILETVQSF